MNLKKHLAIIAGIIAILLSFTTNAIAQKKPAGKPAPKPFTFTISTDIESKNETIVIGINIDSLKFSSYWDIIKHKVEDDDLDDDLDCGDDGKIHYDVVEVSEKPYTVEYDLDCDGDGKYEHIGQTDFQTCSYQRNTGKHQIRIRGKIPAIRLCDMSNLDDKYQSVDNSKAVVSVDDWGDVSWKSMDSFASNCKNLTILPSKAPQLKDVKSVSGMFNNAESFNQSINHWNMSNVRDMEGMFYGAKAFNQPLDKWNVSKVINMSNMFMGATSFDQPLDKWNVSNACYMDSMFIDASSYSHYPSKWTLPDTGWKPPEQYYIFEGTKIEEKEKANPLKLKKRKNKCQYY